MSVSQGEGRDKLLPMGKRVVQVGETVRYARTRSVAPLQDGYLNFHYLSRSPRESDPRIILESGINRVAPLKAVDGSRRL